jgi:hypothetical protein
VVGLTAYFLGKHQSTMQCCFLYFSFFKTLEKLYITTTNRQWGFQAQVMQGVTLQNHTEV